jgi:hypothetical protein
MQPISIHRETFYKEVWEEPMSSLAKRYNISEVGQAKVCSKLQVPVPRGYWAGIRNGHHVAKPKLPKLPPGVSETTSISPIILCSRELAEAVKE